MHVTFEDFAKLEIRIGTVVECDRVATSDRLLRCVVDLGDVKRQVVAGFGHLQSPEQLLGKQVPIVVNIPKVNMRGVDSEGVFIAVDDAMATLLTPEKPVANGTRLK